MKTFKKDFYFVLVAVFLIFCFTLVKNGNFRSSAPKEEPHSQTNSATENIQYVKIGGQTLKVDLALTQKEQEQGLSGRSSLATDEGMLFIFPTPGKYLFWMKDMNFPIDIIWLNENFQVIYIKKNALPELFPETYGPETDSLYVLEVSAGFAEKNNLKVGDTVEFLPF